MIIFCSLQALQAEKGLGDVYVIIYATHDGKSGHAAIAVDKYTVKIRDCSSCPGKVSYDTVRTGELLYYDLWPIDDRFNKERLFDNVSAQFFRLPASSAERPISISSLKYRGIPHEENYPVDGLLRIPTSPQKVEKLKEYLDNLISRDTTFNAVHFNCADFVELGLEYLLKKDIWVDERVLFVYATTPNRLYQVLEKMEGIEVLKDPGELINGSFLYERILHNN